MAAQHVSGACITTRHVFFDKSASSETRFFLLTWPPELDPSGYRIIIGERVSSPSGHHDYQYRERDN